MINEEFKSQLLFKPVMTKEEEKKRRIIELIMLPFKKQLTQEEKEEYFKINEEDIPDDMVHVIYEFTKEYLQTGRISNEMCSKYIQTSPDIVELDEIPEKWRKNPKGWKGLKDNIMFERGINGKGGNTR